MARTNWLACAGAPPSQSVYAPAASHLAALYFAISARAPSVKLDAGSATGSRREYALCGGGELSPPDAAYVRVVTRSDAGVNVNVACEFAPAGSVTDDVDSVPPLF